MIINISSILGITAMPNTSNYAVALECARKAPRVRVNSIHPSFIDTPMVASNMQRLGPKFREYIEDNVPFGELGEPVDTTEGVVYLTSDTTKFVTGSKLVIDGGYVAR